MNGAFVHSVGHDPCKVEKSDRNRYAPPFVRMTERTVNRRCASLGVPKRKKSLYANLLVAASSAGAATPKR